MLPTVAPHQGGGLGSISLMVVMDLVDPARIIAFEGNRNAAVSAHIRNVAGAGAPNHPAYLENI